MTRRPVAPIVPLAAVFDTETTGLTLHPDAPLEAQPKVIEVGIALISLADGSIVEEFNTLVDPGEPVTAEITKITGITNDMLRGQMRFPQIASQIAERLRRAVAVVAHNLPFDKAMLDNEWRRMGGECPWPPRLHCTVAMHFEEWGRNPRLIELYEQTMGRPYVQTHRAIDDVKALIEVIQAREIWVVL